MYVMHRKSPRGGGGGGKGKVGIPQFWPQQACAVHLFVVMSLKNFLIDEHGWTSAFLSQTCFYKSLLTGNLCCSSLANYIIRVLFKKFDIVFLNVFVLCIILQYTLGLSLFNSNMSSEMAQLLKDDQKKYVPLERKADGDLLFAVPIFFDGDALTG